MFRHLLGNPTSITMLASILQNPTQINSLVELYDNIKNERQLVINEFDLACGKSGGAVKSKCVDNIMSLNVAAENLTMVESLLLTPKDTLLPAAHVTL